MPAKAPRLGLGGSSALTSRVRATRRRLGLSIQWNRVQVLQYRQTWEIYHILLGFVFIANDLDS